MEIQQVPGMKNKLLGGEGLFNTRAYRPGQGLAADHAHLRRGGVHPALYPYRQRLMYP